MSDPIVLFVRFRPKPEHRQAVREAFEAIVPLSRAEAGCREFVLHIDREAEGDLCLYEVWDDHEALKSHFAQPYTSAFSQHLADWLAEPPSATKLIRL